MTDFLKIPNIIAIIVILAIASLFFTQPPNIVVPISDSQEVVSRVTVVEDDSLASVNSTIIEVVTGHAWNRHGADVNAAFRCLNDNGSARSFKTFGMTDDKGNPLQTNLWLCNNGTDWFAVVTTALEKVGGNRIGRLITAYKVSKDTFPNIDSFVASIKTNWRAIEINFIIEAGSVFFQPK